VLGVHLRVSGQRARIFEDRIQRVRLCAWYRWSRM